MSGKIGIFLGDWGPCGIDALHIDSKKKQIHKDTPEDG